MSDDEVPVIHSIIRVNPEGYEPDDVMLRSEISEVELYDPSEQLDSTETWIVDELAERNDRSSGSDGQEILFSSQSDLYDSFTHWLNESVFIKADALTCLVVGGRGGGKSYTLFGRDTVEDRGVIPRFVQSLYEVDTSAPKEKGTAYHFNSKLQHLMMSMYMVHGDKLMDLLDPPKEYPIDGNVAYFETFGATPLGIKACHSDTEQHSLQLLHLGILSASMIALNSEFLFNSVDIYVNFKLFYPNKVQTVTFIEASSLLMLHSGAVEDSGFPKPCAEMRSAEAFKQSGLYGALAVDKEKIVNKKSGYESSFLTYMLQDALVLNGYKPNSTYLTSTLVIGCLRGTADCFSDNKITLDLIQSMGEKHKEMITKFRAKPVNPELYRQRLTHQISVLKLSDELVTLRNVVEKELKHKLPVIQKGDKTHTPRMEKLMKYEKKKKQLKLEFYDKKMRYLTETLELLSAKQLKKKVKRHDLRVVKTWLRSRGLFGLFIQAEPDRDDPEYQIQQLMAGMSIDSEDVDDDRHETVEYPSVPWSTDGLPVSEAYFMPITQLNFPSGYLFLGLPSGHMAICSSPIRFYAEHEETGELMTVEGPPPKAHFEGIKHCKVMPLDGILLNDQHCILFRLGTSVKIRPVLCEEERTMSFVEVNSVVVEEETVLQDGDVIRIGSTLMFVLKIPAESDAESRKTLSRKSSSNYDVMSDYGDEDDPLANEGLNRIITMPLDLVATGNVDPCMCASLQNFFLKVLAECLTNNLMKAHATVDRELVDLTLEAQKTEEMDIVTYVPTVEELLECCSTMSVAHKAILTEAVLAALHANHWAVKMKRDMSFTVHLRKKYSHSRSSRKEYRGAHDGVVLNGEVYDIKILAECLYKGQRSSRGDSWWWGITVFMQRVFQMRLMYHDFVWKFSMDVDILDDRYRGVNNPFIQPTEPELIGVCNIHLDNVFYLFDTRQKVPVISFKGNHAGDLTFKLRCWIDKVEALPDYLKLDYNAKFSDFMGRTCVMRFYFESLTDINPNLSNHIQIAHSFFCHSGQYRTTRLPARDQIKGDTVSYIDNACMLSQVITMDFIRYTTKRSIELEIWGCRTADYSKGEGTELDGEEVVTAPEPIQEFKVGELSTVRNLKLPDLGSNAKGKMDAFERVKEEALGAVDEDSEGDGESLDAFDEASVDNLTLADISDPEELKRQLKEVSARLIEAEKTYKRASKTADTYKVQVGRLNPTGVTTKRKFSVTPMRGGVTAAKGLNKDLQMQLMEKELEALRNGAKRKGSTACTVS